MKKTMPSAIGTIDWLCLVRRLRRLTLGAAPAALADHHRSGGIDITCISPNGFVLPPCRRRLAKPVLPRTNSPAGTSAAVVVPDWLMRNVKSRTGLQPPSLSRVSIAPADGIDKQSLVYPRYSRRRAASGRT